MSSVLVALIKRKWKLTLGLTLSAGLVLSICAEKYSTTQVPLRGFDIEAKLKGKTLAPVQVAIEEVSREGYFWTTVHLRGHVRINRNDYRNAKLKWILPENVSATSGEVEMDLEPDKGFQIKSFDLIVEDLAELERPEVSLKVETEIRDQVFGNAAFYTFHYSDTYDSRMKRRAQRQREIATAKGESLPAAAKMQR